MCILSPYLVAAGRHPNIKLITYAQVESVTGKPGCFTVKVNKKASSIISERRTGCRACLDACQVTCTTV
jgi:heterodisulfide reductase subunit A